MLSSLLAGIGGEEEFYWLSFADPKLPEGKQFLGVIITISTSFIAATTKTHEMKINPGGEVQFLKVPLEFGRQRIKDEHLDKLLSAEELDSYNLL